MKRKRKSHSDSRATKRHRAEHVAKDHPTWPLLRQYYPNVLTLRQYLVSKLGDASKRRRKRIIHFGLDDRGDVADGSRASVVQLVDYTAVGSFEHSTIGYEESIEKDITIFTQQVSECSTIGTLSQGELRQSEIVDFAIWKLFRNHHGYHTPSHMLARGYQKYASMSNHDGELAAVPGVPGLFSNCTNPCVEALKGSHWSNLPSLLGNYAETILSDLLLNCGVFQPVENSSNLNQLSGVPLSELKPLRSGVPEQQVTSNADGLRDLTKLSDQAADAHRGLSDIRFVRHRMLYAKPNISARGKVRAALGRNHVLNRYLDTESQEETTHVMRYMFPKQFRLHNVFTSATNPKETAQPFRDYTIREQEIPRSIHCWMQKRPAVSEETEATPPLPKRLRGQVQSLIARLRKRHSRCSYASMLDHYCPNPLQQGSESNESIAQASSPTNVSSFCRAAISKVFPGEFWGSRECGLHNKRNFMKRIDGFVRLRRYESLTLHDVIQDLKIRDIEWLAPQEVDGTLKLSATDFAKRKELMAELLYYLFDSFLIPLIRANFHVTESGVHRNQLFYFRHDVWQTLSEPALATLKDSMLEECNAAAVKRGMARRALGVSQVRLLPKEQGMRPIINLRRRVQKLQHGRLVLGRSINSILTPAFSILNYEKTGNPEVLASSMFSVEDIYPRLQSFRTILQQQGLFGQPLYFAKVDVKACFDTIPQKRLMKLAETVLGANTYDITKYARAKLIGKHNQETPGFGAKPSWRYLTKATSKSKDNSLKGEMEKDAADGRTRSVYVDGITHRAESRRAILELLEEHIQSNLIKLGNRFYRQKEGIPQGSIVSSLLCSYFYGELERRVLGFVNDGQSILLRLIDDFLVISTKQAVAERFVREMHGGIPEFGVEVKEAKTRVNFDVEVDGKAITRLPAETEFSYCGNAINTVTLDLSKDRERRKRTNIPDSVSVEHSKIPGQTFYRKTLNALKLQMQTMLLSTSYNSLPTVLRNLQHSFTEVAQKSYYYIHSLPADKRPPSTLVIRAVNDLIKLASVLMKRRKRSSKDILPYECSVSHTQTRWAYRDVFRRRQTGHAGLLRWVEEQLALPGLQAQTGRLEAVVDGM